ncbi:cytochrome c-type biogenesis protein CcmH [Neobacillus niacini]|uniref:cytochrome c-type biogenesis protein CcmH n=1 Tax=Neobacillus niacini TaxID=86668 RepID=UPI00203EC69F|nr:cytochrome c-type biogenesis protein CcmH [Neobacillus niacini]MCM3693411.1 cytochrome c-type biogenesis protein CcmH [Neobacillus niacini]
MKRILVIFSLITLFLGTMQVYAEEQLSEKNYDYTNREFMATVDMLYMDGHSNDDLSNCSVKQLYYEEVAEMFFTKGMSKKEILDYYSNELGVEALNAPPVKGFNLSLWITPFLLITLVLIILFFVMRKWKKNQKVSTDEGDFSDSEMDDIYESIIEDERKKFI